MATIVYLDVEDEITSAATRIRTAGESRVALVLPFGSRLATSRINFRLLAREALVNGRRLDIVAPDASARALAASAGLSVFASTSEYEVALEERTGDGGGASSAAATAVVSGAGGGAGTGAAAVAAGTARTRPRTPDPVEETDGTGRLVEEPVDRRRGEPRVAHAPRRRRIGGGAIAGFGVFAVAVAVAGVAAFLFLPTAEITVTPHIEPVGPISLDVRADPAATAVDVDAGVIPAQTISIPVTASAEFPATGKRIEKTPATGGVRWTNCDPTAAYTIPKGTTVKTSEGIGFSTDEVVFLPVATLSGTPPNVKVKCQTSEVGVTAVTAGLAGNVDAGAIRVVPARYNRTVISVSNPSATTGGTREEFPQVSQEDVDAAVEQLRLDIEGQFASALAQGTGAPARATVFPETAVLGEPVPTLDPTTLVGQEVASFTLGLTAAGQVLAVDASPVEAIAETRLRGSIKTGYSIVDGSTRVTVGEGTVVGGTVTFPATAVAKQVRPLDGEALRQQVIGLGEDEARAVLAPYGDVELTLWPAWVSSVPGMAQRVTLTVADPVDVSPGTSPSAAPTEEPTVTPPEESPS